MLEKYIEILQQNRNLSIEQAYDCLRAIFSGNCVLEEIKEVLGKLADKGETSEEIVGFTQAMRDNAVKVNLDKAAFDTCGTGGTQHDRFNVSTSSTFILAAEQVPVAKHGNKGSKKPNGSFDFLEALDINYNLNQSQIEQIFSETQLCFLFARSHHLAMKYVAEARKQLARQTIFNIIGPLSNPADVKFQIIGCTNRKIAQKIAKALQILGSKKALVVEGAHNIDEISTAGDSFIMEVSSTEIKEYYFSPLKELGIEATESEIRGGLAYENAQIFKKIFSQGILEHPITQLICLNAGAAFYCFNRTSSIKEGYLLAQKVLESGKAWEKYLQYQRLAKQY